MAVSIVTVARWPLLRGDRYDMAGFRHELEVETRQSQPLSPFVVVVVAVH